MLTLEFGEVPGWMWFKSPFPMEKGIWDSSTGLPRPQPLPWGVLEPQTALGGGPSFPRNDWLAWGAAMGCRAGDTPFPRCSFRGPGPEALRCMAVMEGEGTCHSC